LGKSTAKEDSSVKGPARLSAAVKGSIFHCKFEEREKMCEWTSRAEAVEAWEREALRCEREEWRWAQVRTLAGSEEER
jgi:hypothetical protein